MPKKSNWIWHLYFLMYCITAAHQAWEFTNTDSSLNTYYHILIAYHNGYLVHYIRNALSVILNAFSVVPFYLFLYRVPWLSQTFWRWFLVFRIISDVTGRTYEMMIIRALFHQDTSLGKNAVILFVLVLLPSYIALLNYAFSRSLRVKTDAGQPARPTT